MILLLGLTVSLADPSPEPSPEPPGAMKGDLKKMQGTWGIVSISGPGAAPVVKEVKFVFEKDTLAIKGLPGGMAISRKIKLSVVKGVGHFDLMEGGGIKPVKGIYKWEKDQLVLVAGKPEAGRPTNFDGPGLDRVVLKKEGK
jgi:uncharacterized protein (TIGR03067 family)